MGWGWGNTEDTRRALSRVARALCSTVLFRIESRGPRTTRQKISLVVFIAPRLAGLTANYFVLTVYDTYPIQLSKYRALHIF